MTKTMIPEEALLSHVAFLGKTGAGKTTAAVTEIEWLHDAGRRCCIIDPTGVYWGLRLAADGKRPGLPFVIFGGPRADVPLAPSYGEHLAMAVAHGNFSCIIDTSQLKVSVRTRWACDFFEALFRFNSRPLHLVVDEAHVFAPKGKVPSPQAGIMLHEFNNLVSGGRVKGLRIALLTQRPAKLHNDSLTQVETLVAMRCLAPHDREAVMSWIGEWGDAGTGKTINAELPNLPRGVAWVWSPEVGFLDRVQFPTPETFDSRKAPEDGAEAAAPAKLEDVDLGMLRELLAGPPEEARPTPPGILAQIDAARAEGFSRGHAEGVRQGQDEARRAAFSAALGELRPVIQRLEELAYEVVAEPRRDDDSAYLSKKEATDYFQSADLPAAGEVRNVRILASYRKPPQDPEKPKRRRADVPPGEISGAAQSVLDAARRGWRQMTWGEAAILAGLVPGGGYFNTLRKELRDAGWGGEPPPPSSVMESGPTARALLDTWAKKLSAPLPEMLTLLFEEGPRTKGQMAQRLGKSSTGGYWNTVWKKVRMSSAFAQDGDRVDVHPLIAELREREAAA